MARLTRQGAKQVYEAAQRFADSALRSDDSLFTPGKPIWSKAVVEDLYDRYVVHEDLSSGSFSVRLRKQLQDAPPDTIQLMGEVLFVHLLIISDISGAAKRKTVKEVLSGSPSPVSIPIELERTFDHGLSSLGVGKTSRFSHIQFLVEFARSWKGLAKEKRDQILRDPWAFEDFASSVTVKRAGTQREALLHLLFPDTFESIVSLTMKQQIADALGGMVDTLEDTINRRLYKIREKLTGQYGPDFQFYDERVRALWEDGVKLGKDQAGAGHISLDGASSENEGRDNAKNPYETLTLSLASKGLHFSDELISNYLLALQTKRFVILTGISGTGKTRLALEIAKSFPAYAIVPSATSVPEDSLQLKVQPYMLKNHQMVLPKALMANLLLPPLAPHKSSSQINVEYPKGQMELNLYRDVERNVSVLVFKGEFRSWFDGALKIGDIFFVDVDSPEGEEAQRLRFTLPTNKTLRLPLKNYRSIAVRPDWTDNRGLLGYYNPLTNGYSTTEFLRLVIEASDECERAAKERRDPFPFFVIFDEMNLAHVEYYFSDLLSTLESDEPLQLHDDPGIEASGNEELVAIPRQLGIPDNIYFTGTVNVDETTYMFSPKVLDRAFAIELNQVDLAGYGSTSTQNASPIRLQGFPGTLTRYKRPDLTDWEAMGRKLGGELRGTLIELNDLLAEEHRQFGYRVANEIARFVNLASDQAGASPDTLWSALDIAIMQKVLPKFHGTQQELEIILAGFFAFAMAGRIVSPAENFDPARWKLANGKLQPTGTRPDETLSEPKLPRTAAKLWRMLNLLHKQGFASFIE